MMVLPLLQGFILNWKVNPILIEIVKLLSLLLVNIDNKVFNNHNLLEKTLAAGLCLFSVSGDRSFPMHDYYRY